MRRYKELLEKGEKVEYAEVEENVRKRDYLDACAVPCLVCGFQQGQRAHDVGAGKREGIVDRQTSLCKTGSYQHTKWFENMAFVRPYHLL